MQGHHWRELFSSIKEENWQQAIDLVNSLITSEPDDPTHFLKLGDFYREKRNYEGAKRAYVKAAELYKQAGLKDKAILALKKATQIDSVDVELHRRLLELMLEVPVEEIDAIEDLQETEHEEIDIEKFLSSDILPEVFQDSTIKEMLKAQPVRRYSPGQTIIKEGDRGREIYLVFEGQVRVVTEINGKPVEIARLGPGDIFGEMAFLTYHKRVASVVSAEEGSLVLEISPESLEKMISAKAEILKYLYDLYRSRIKEDA